MSDPFVGEIRMFAGNFAPRGWALCDGQLLATSTNGALFSLLGVIYGGDGVTTFGLPDLRGRVPLHAGSGLGLTPRRLGLKSGQEQVTLLNRNFPDHSHAVNATAPAALKFNSGNANESSPVGNSLATARGGEERFSTATADGEMHSSTVQLAGTTSTTGGGQPHNNLPPYLCINFIIALVGIYPSRY